MVLDKLFHTELWLMCMLYNEVLKIYTKMNLIFRKNNYHSHSIQKVQILCFLYGQASLPNVSLIIRNDFQGKMFLIFCAHNYMRVSMAVHSVQPSTKASVNNSDLCRFQTYQYKPLSIIFRLCSFTFWVAMVLHSLSMSWNRTLQTHLKTLISNEMHW